MYLKVFQVKSGAKRTKGSTKPKKTVNYFSVCGSLLCYISQHVKSPFPCPLVGYAPLYCLPSFLDWSVVEGL